MHHQTTAASIAAALDSGTRLDTSVVYSLNHRAVSPDAGGCMNVNLWWAAVACTHACG